MKKCCKHIDITDPNTNLPFVSDCIDRHFTRNDFARMLFRFGMNKKKYFDLKRSRDADFAHAYKHASKKEKVIIDAKINAAIEDYETTKQRIAIYAANCIRIRKVSFAPIVYGERYDPTTDKVRIIGREEPLQQVFDYIAVRSCDELFGRKIVKQQASSIKGRGQVYGTRIIKKWVDSDNRSAKYASKHGFKYTRKCKWVVKLDIKKCYPSADMNIFMKFLRHDCANEDIIWLWEAILKTHQYEGYTGFMIGSFPSQWAMQYMLSFVYRYAMSINTHRRGKRIKSITHAVLFMDDIGLFGSSRKNLKKAVQMIIEFVRVTLGLTIKPNWHICEFAKSGIDMMGYVVHSSGKVTIRDRNYIKSRRMVLRCLVNEILTDRQCKRLLSFKGMFKHSNSLRFANKKYHICSIFGYAARMVSRNQKIQNNRGGPKNVKHGSIFYRYSKASPIQQVA